MDPRDRLRTLVDGVACAACRSPVAAADVRLLAQRDDLAFVELACRACSTTGLAIVVDASGRAPRVLDDVLDDAAWGGRAHGSTRPPIVSDDVLDMHLMLASWGGDLRTLVDHAGERRGEAGR